MLLEDRVLELKGVGPKTESLFHRVGVDTVGDLLAFYPRSYDRMEDPVPVSEALHMETAAIRAVVVSTPSVLRTRHTEMVSVWVADSRNERIRAVWYGMPYMKNRLDPGVWYILRGKTARGKNGFFCSSRLFSGRRSMPRNR